MTSIRILLVLWVLVIRKFRLRAVGKKMSESWNFRQLVIRRRSDDLTRMRWLSRTGQFQLLNVYFSRQTRIKRCNYAAKYSFLILMDFLCCCFFQKKTVSLISEEIFNPSISSFSDSGKKIFPRVALHVGGIKRMQELSNKKPKLGGGGGIAQR